MLKRKYYSIFNLQSYFFLLIHLACGKVFVMSYSVEFRECVVDNINSGMPWEEAIRVFKVSRNSIGRWLRMKKQSGDVSDVSRRKYKTRKIDTNELLSLLEASPDATLAELAQPFNVCHSAIDYHLRKLNITRKKNHALRGAERGKKAGV